MKSHQYIAAGFFAAATSFLPLGTFAQTAPQTSQSATADAWTVAKYISMLGGKETDKAAADYLINCINDILTDLDSPNDADGTPRSPEKIAKNQKLSKFIDNFFVRDAHRMEHFLALDGFMTQANRSGEGSKTVESAIFSYLALTLRTQKAANSNPNTAAEKPAE